MTAAGPLALVEWVARTLDAVDLGIDRRKLAATLADAIADARGQIEALERGRRLEIAARVYAAIYLAVDGSPEEAAAEALRAADALIAAAVKRPVEAAAP